MAGLARRGRTDGSVATSTGRGNRPATPLVRVARATPRLALAGGGLTAETRQRCARPARVVRAHGRSQPRRDRPLDGRGNLERDGAYRYGPEHADGLRPDLAAHGRGLGRGRVPPRRSVRRVLAPIWACSQAAKVVLALRRRAGPTCFADPPRSRLLARSSRTRRRRRGRDDPRTYPSFVRRRPARDARDVVSLRRWTTGVIDLRCAADRRYGRLRARAAVSIGRASRRGAVGSEHRAARRRVAIAHRAQASRIWHSCSLAG